MTNTASNNSSNHHCALCKLQSICLPQGLAFKDFEKFEHLTEHHRKIGKGQSLYRYGDPFESLFMIRVGFMKSCISSADGNEQVAGFHMSGDWVGFDGLASKIHTCELTALEDGEVCVIPFKKLEALCSSIPKLTSHVLEHVGKEIIKKHETMLLLGNMHANERLASFLLSLSERFEARGYSRSEFVLRMTRAEIGSYLGLKLETVSRSLSKFTEMNLIEINQKHVHILDPEALRSIASDGLLQK